MNILAALRRNMAWHAVPIAGLAGGVAFLLTLYPLTALLLPIDGNIMLRYFSSLVLGEAALVDERLLVLGVGLLVHLALSVLMAFVIGVVVHRWGLWVGIIGGAVLGLSFYGLNTSLFTRILGWFAWFVAVDHAVFAISHVVFGAVAGGVYEYLDDFDLPLMDPPGGDA